jgi:hypothetical protein
MVKRATFIEKLTEVQQTVAQLLAQLQASEADKFVMHLYTSTETVPASLRATEQGQQGHRARDSVKLPDRAELGVQRRFSSLGALVADSRLRQMRRFPGNGRELRLHFS